MSNSLQKRADELRAHYAKLESVPGSGYHDDDKNPTRSDIYHSPQRAGCPVGKVPPGGWGPRMSEHLVGFFDHDGDETVEFVGADAQKAHAALQSWHSKNNHGDVSKKTGTDRKLLLKIIPALRVETVEGLPRLSVWLCDWNDVLAALCMERIGVTGLHLEE